MKSRTRQQQQRPPAGEDQVGNIIQSLKEALLRECLQKGVEEITRKYNIKALNSIIPVQATNNKKQQDNEQARIAKELAEIRQQISHLNESISGLARSDSHIHNHNNSISYLDEKRYNNRNPAQETFGIPPNKKKSGKNQSQKTTIRTYRQPAHLDDHQMREVLYQKRYDPRAEERQLQLSRKIKPHPQSNYDEVYHKCEERYENLAKSVSIRPRAQSKIKENVRRDRRKRTPRSYNMSESLPIPNPIWSRSRYDTQRKGVTEYNLEPEVDSLSDFSQY